MNNVLTTCQEGLCILAGMAKKSITNPHGVHEIFTRRQPKRPHFLREWIERRNFETDSEFANEVGADKSLVSRWLDENNPTTPGREWQVKLGFFFGEADNPANIFEHPDDDWLRRFFRNRDAEEIDRIKRSLEVTFPPKQVRK